MNDMNNPIQHVVVTIDRDYVSVTYVRRHNSRVYFFYEGAKYFSVVRTIETCVDVGFALQAKVDNKLYYAPAPIPGIVEPIRSM